MKQWIVVLIVLVIGVAAYGWWFGAPEEPAVSTAQIAQPVVQEEQPTLAEPKSVESPKPPSQELDLTQFIDVRGPDLGLALVRSTPDFHKRVELLLALIEEQHLNVNETIDWIVGNETITPIWVAFEISRGNITTAQFQRFLDLGATLQRNDFYEDEIGYVMNKDILSTWYDEAGLGPEDHQYMFDLALLRGNAELAELVWVDKGGRFDQVQLSKESVQNFMNDYQGVQPLNEEKLADLVKGTTYGDVIFEAIITRHLNKIARIELLKDYGNLNSSQREQLEHSESVMLSDLDIMRRILAKAREHFAEQAKAQD
ncbi:hypothetical protein CWE22_08650 [Pseudidiomarina aestuarii]|uniref:Uncharacterized protein n=1 Tax=Pseudidiomarina aestuarii TaxID=624146 RepID=A0A7Z6ZVL1_9GAMM|nr:hypothetical protein [Pseudidiomarina aestuarii]RUO42199.1 hypothetical protein CWE22_08650 [Pseudidiomarina aestuarii]